MIPYFFLRDSVLILNGKENKEAGAICFELRVPRKKNNEIFWKVPSKIYGSHFIMEKNKNIWFFNNSEYHHREMGLKSKKINTAMKFTVDIRIMKPFICFNKFITCPKNAFEKLCQFIELLLLHDWVHLMRHFSAKRKISATWQPKGDHPSSKHGAWRASEPIRPKWEDSIPLHWLASLFLTTKTFFHAILLSLELICFWGFQKTKLA